MLIDKFWTFYVYYNPVCIAGRPSCFVPPQNLAQPVSLIAESCARVQFHGSNRGMLPMRTPTTSSRAPSCFSQADLLGRCRSTTSGAGLQPPPFLSPPSYIVSKYPNHPGLSAGSELIHLSRSSLPIPDAWGLQTMA
eukprot:1160386-Pelagomonas_calceolata.AAC.3